MLLPSMNRISALAVTQPCPMPVSGERLVKEGYKIALVPRANSDSQEVSQQRYTAMLEHLAGGLITLLGQQDLQTQEKMPAFFQELLVMAITSKKGEADKSITEEDISAVLQDLSTLDSAIDQKSVLKGYSSQPELLCLLEQGVQNYNAKVGTTIELVSKQTSQLSDLPSVNGDTNVDISWTNLPGDLVREVHDYLPRTDRANWANSCHTMNDLYEHRYSWPLINNEQVTRLIGEGVKLKQIYAEHPGLRNPKDIARDESGRQFLRDQGVGGPLNNQKLLDGEATLADLFALKEKKLKEIAESDQIGENFQELLKIPSIVRYLVDGSLSTTDANTLDYGAASVLETPFMQQCIDKKDLLLKDVLKYAIFLKPLSHSEPCASALKEHINSGSLTFAQIFEMYDQGRLEYLMKLVISDSEKTFIENESFTVMELIELPLYKREFLNNAGTLSLLKEDIISFKDLIVFSRHDVANLLKLEVQKY